MKHWDVGVAILLCAGGAAACESITDNSPPAVRFRMESQTCPGPIAFELAIDDAIVATDTLRDQESSADFETQPGTRALHAEIVDGMYAKDTSVTLRHGQRLTVLLSPFCS